MQRQEGADGALAGEAWHEVCATGIGSRYEEQHGVPALGTGMGSGMREAWHEGEACINKDG
jgi:hypothetical protein